MNSNINVKTYGITDPRFGSAVNRIFLVVEELDSKDKLYENYNFDGLNRIDCLHMLIDYNGLFFKKRY